MGFFASLFNAPKMNADPEQQEFARLFISAVEQGKEVDLINWLVKRHWRASETRTRIAHAISIVKIASVPETYRRAKEIGLRINNETYRY